MWHEARKQEKKIRGMMVDYRKRAERRRDFYEKFKADPTQFLQLHGRPYKIHLDPAVAAAGDSPAVTMPWQGHPEVLIDRFDVRAHLDVIADTTCSPDTQELSYEERTINYERYRILVQNEFLRVNEEKFLKQIHLEEQFGPIALKQQTGEKELTEKEKRKKGAAIGYQYEDSTVHSHGTDHLTAGNKPKEEQANTDSEDSDVDFDLCLDVSQIDTPCAHEMNAVGQRYGLTGNDFYSFLTNDVEEQEAMRLAKQQEEEKAMFSGRKARRERQAFREKKLIGRVMSPPSYAARKSPTYDKYKKSASRSVSPENTGQITYITSFGGEGEDSHDEARKSVKSVKPGTGSSVKKGGSRSKKQGAPGVGYSLASSLKQLISSRKARTKSRSPTRSRSRTRSKSRSIRTRSRSRSQSYSSNSSRSSRSKSKVSVSTRSRSRSGSMSSMTSSSGSSHARPRAKASKDNSGTAPSETKPTLPRYYGRRGKSSSSDLDGSSDSNTETSLPYHRRDGGESRPEASHSRHDTDRDHSVGNAGAASKLYYREKPQDKLKKKMQAMLNKQFRLDKKAEKERLEKAERERADREAELRDISIKMRRRERYLRHLNEEDKEPGGSSGSRGSRSRSRSPTHSRSPSPRSPRTPKRTLVDY